MIALNVIDEAIRRIEAAMPTPMNLRGEMNIRIEHHAGLLFDLRKSREAIAELVNAVSDVYGDDGATDCSPPCPSCRINAAIQAATGEPQ